MTDENEKSEGQDAGAENEEKQEGAKAPESEPAKDGDDDGSEAAGNADERSGAPSTSLPESEAPKRDDEGEKAN
jgi:hypothetical protein